MAGVTGGSRVAMARDLARTRAMPAGQLTDGEIGNEVRAAGTTDARRDELDAEAAERKAARAAVAGPLPPEALQRIRERLGVAFAAREGL